MRSLNVAYPASLTHDVCCGRALRVWGAPAATRPSSTRSTPPISFVVVRCLSCPGCPCAALQETTCRLQNPRVACTIEGCSVDRGVSALAQVWRRSSGVVGGVLLMRVPFTRRQKDGRCVEQCRRRNITEAHLDCRKVVFPLSKNTTSPIRTPALVAFVLVFWCQLLTQSLDFEASMHHPPVASGEQRSELQSSDVRLASLLLVGARSHLGQGCWFTRCEAEKVACQSWSIGLPFSFPFVSARFGFWFILRTLDPHRAEGRPRGAGSRRRFSSVFKLPGFKSWSMTARPTSAECVLWIEQFVHF